MEDPDGYWAERAESLVSWFQKWERVVDADLYKPEVRWFDGATLNVSYNCLDRHLANGKKDKVAIIWQGDVITSYSIHYTKLYEFAILYAVPKICGRPHEFGHSVSIVIIGVLIKEHVRPNISTFV